MREQDKVVGHAVRAMYLYSGMADIATEYGDDSLRGGARPALGRPDDQAASTSPAASARRPHNEGFTDDYDLPNETRLCRDLRLGRPGVLGEPHARHGARTRAMPT